jgi:hypothetical protein
VDHDGDHPLGSFFLYPWFADSGTIAPHYTQQAVSVLSYSVRYVLLVGPEPWLEGASMANIHFYDQFQAVSERCNREGIAAGFPTCEQTATADPYIFNHIVVLLRNNDVALSNPTAGQLGIDPYSVVLTPGRWREGFTSANAYAHGQNFFHGFPTFQRIESADGLRFVVVLIRSTGPRPAGNGVTWRDIPAEEVFP